MKEIVLTDNAELRDIVLCSGRAIVNSTSKLALVFRLKRFNLQSRRMTMNFELEPFVCLGVLSF